MSSPAEIACDYVDRGWAAIPVRPRGKIPTMRDWQKTKLSKEQVRLNFGAESNIGVVLGQNSGGLIDVDIDSSEAAFAWQHFGLPTDSSFGRESNPNSHHLFQISEPVKRTGFSLPQATGNLAGMLIELRGDGGQTMMPGSVHPSGERVEWVTNGSPSTVDYPILLRSVVLTATSAALLKVVPSTGGRNDFYLVVTGFLSRYVSEDVCLQIVEILTTWSQDEEAVQRSQIVRDTYKKIRNGVPASGIPTASDQLGKSLVNTVIKWLELVYSHQRHERVKTKNLEFAEFAGSHSNETKRFSADLHPAALSGLAGDFVRTVSPHSESDPVALLAQFLVACGSIIGKTPYFRVEADRHFPNEMIVLVGETSRGRKGSSLGWVVEVAKSADLGWSIDRIANGLSSGEGLVNEVRDPIEKLRKARSKEEKAEADRRGMIVELVDPGVEDKRLLVVESEFANVLAQTKRDGNTLSVVLRDAWDGKNLRVMNKNSPLKATAPHISVIGHITQHELKSLMSEVSYWNGLANRHLFFWVKRGRLQPRGGQVPAEKLDQITAELRSSLEAAKKIDFVDMTDAAWETWDKVYESLASNEPKGVLGAIQSRIEPHIRRLAMIYAVLDRSKIVDLPHLQAAIALIDYSIRSCQHIFGSSRATPEHEKVLTAIDESGGSLTQTEVSTQVFQKHKSAQELSDIAEQLVNEGLIEVREQVGDSSNHVTKVWVRTGEISELKTRTGLEEFLPDPVNYQDQNSVQGLLGEV